MESTHLSGSGCCKNTFLRFLLLSFQQKDLACQFFFWYGTGLNNPSFGMTMTEILKDTFLRHTPHLSGFYNNASRDVHLLYKLLPQLSMSAENVMSLLQSTLDYPELFYPETLLSRQYFQERNNYYVNLHL